MPNPGITEPVRQEGATSPADSIAPIVGWLRPRILRAYDCGKHCQSKHDERDGMTDKASMRYHERHAAAYIGEMVSAKTGEVHRRYLCVAAAAQMASRFGMPFPGSEIDDGRPSVL